MHGWVLPADDKAARYAVGWKGVIYPLKTVGTVVNIADDLAPNVRGRFFDGDWPLDDRRSLSIRAALRIQVALRLRVDQLSSRGNPLAQRLRAVFRLSGQVESRSNQIIFSVAADDGPRP